MQGALTFHIGHDGIEVTRPDPLPIARLIVGKPVAEAAALMPRLFNLCSMAQEVAVRQALGMTVAAGAQARLTHDILLEHLARFFVFLPPLVDLKPKALPHGWERAPEALRPLVFGGDGRLPHSRTELKHWLAKGEGLAPVIAAIGARFLPGEAATKPLPPPSLDSLFTPAPIENSLAARHTDHPLMRDIEAFHGRGPLWRALARLLDLEACLLRKLPHPHSPAPGQALVAAARGTYAVTAKATAGIVTALERVTPTDHMLAPGGILEAALATLPRERHGELNLVLALLDPCLPVTVREASHA